MIKTKKRKVLLLPGDGIGPEVISEVKKWAGESISGDYTVIKSMKSIKHDGMEIKPENMFDGRKNTFWESDISKGSGVNITFDIPKKVVAIEIDTRLACCNYKQGELL